MIRIIREENEIGANMAFNVIIDGKSMTTINNGETKAYNINAGNHRISLKCAGLISDEIKFHIEDEEVIEFECGTNVTDNPFSKLATHIFKGNKGLYIRIRADII